MACSCKSSSVKPVVKQVVKKVNGTTKKTTSNGNTPSRSVARKLRYRRPI